MKAIIPCCLWELVTERFGKEKWGDILETSGLGRSFFLLEKDDVPDEQVYQVVEATCTVLDISFEQAADAFGEHWMNDFAPRVYPGYLRRAKCAKDLIVFLPKLHEYVTENIPDAHPPRFELTWEDDKTLIMTYISQRPLIDFAVGLLRGIGKYYGEALEVTKLGDRHIKVQFPTAGNSAE